MAGSYDPNSYDSVLAKLLERLDHQDRVSMAYRNETLDILEKLQADVASLKSWRDMITAKTAGISAAVSIIGIGITWAWDHIFK